MTTEYRLMQPDELEQILNLWMDVYPDTDRERWRAELLSIPESLVHTYVAAENGRVLSTALLWIREMNDSSGILRRTGNVSHVATHPEHRNRGHAKKLLELVIHAMEQERCALSTLFTSEEARPLYEKLGWQTCPLTLWQGMLANMKLPESANYSIRLAQLSEEPNLWEALSDIYAEFNESRPLTIRRDELTWKSFIAFKITDWFQVGAALWMAYRPESPEKICGYLLAHGSDQGFLVAEAGVRKGHREALPHLLGKVISSYEEGQPVGGRLYLPNEPDVTALLHSCFKPLTQIESNDMMVRQIDSNADVSDVMMPRSQAGAMFWLLDQL